MVPTPLLYYATYSAGNGTGVMLTGSHNPMNYNGLKIMVSGETLSGDDIQNLKERLLTHHVHIGKGTLHEQRSIKHDYFKCITNDIAISRPLRIVVDGGNGVGGETACELYRLLGCDVIPLYCTVDGYFPNHHPDPSRPENLTDLIHKVQYMEADLGLALDGDGDRLGVVTYHGEIIYPDRQLMLYAYHVLKQNQGATILYDVKCTKNVGEFVRANGGNPVMAPTGHALMKKKLKQTNAALAGEMSGHMFFNDRWFGFDDGLYTGARLLEILSYSHDDLDTLFQTMPQSINTPEININVEEQKKFELIDALKQTANTQFPDADVIDIDGIRLEFDDGWGLVRASNTSPCLVTRFEADSNEALSRIQNQMIDWIDSLID
jgi:phosphomannomutase/phosphoglucomutase